MDAAHLVRQRARLRRATGFGFAATVAAGSACCARPVAGDRLRADAPMLAERRERHARSAPGGAAGACGVQPRVAPGSARSGRAARRASTRARERYVENSAFRYRDRMIGRVVLSDRTIRRLLEEGRIEIDPYDESLMQPSSLDVRVDRYFRVFRNSRYPYIDVKQAQEELTELVEIDDEAVHPPSGRVRARLDARAGARCPTTSWPGSRGSRARSGGSGLLIHSTAGFIDPGWDGHVTLELSNVANLPITIYHGMKIGQLSFVQLTRAGGDAVRLGRARLEVPGAAGPDAEPLLAELRSDPGHGRHGLRRLADRPRAARREPAGAGARARRSGRGASAARSGCETVVGDMTEPAQPARGPSKGVDTVVHLVAILHRQARGLRARDDAGHARSGRGREGGRAYGASSSCPRSATDERDEGARPLLRREVGRWSRSSRSRASST